MTIQTGYLKTKNGTQLFTTVPYPVGAIYLSVDSTDPGKLFGGTWEQIWGGYLYAAGQTISKTEYYGWGTQGHILTTSEMPSHSHTLYGNSNFGASSGAAGYYGINASVVTGWCYGGEVDVNNGYGTRNSGAGQSHSHNIATIDVFVWKRVA